MTLPFCLTCRSTSHRCAQSAFFTIATRMQGDYLHTLAYSYDCFSNTPILAVAGKKGLIYILDVEQRRLRQIFKGHGGVSVPSVSTSCFNILLITCVSSQDIFDLSFSPTSPHMLASASADQTTRIWNIFGPDLDEPLNPLPTTHPDDNVLLSHDFPMGRADEGEALVAILAGQGDGGHRAQVVGVVSFRPGS